MNKYLITANVVKKPELRYTSNQKEVVNLDVAINNGKDDTTFLGITFFGNTAKFLNEYTDKGSKVAIECIVKNNNYEKDGKMVYSYAFIGRTVELLGKKEDTQSGVQTGSQTGVQDTTNVFADFGKEIETQSISEQINSAMLPF